MCSFLIKMYLFIWRRTKKMSAHRNLLFLRQNGKHLNLKTIKIFDWFTKRNTESHPFRWTPFMLYVSLHFITHIYRLICLTYSNDVINPFSSEDPRHHLNVFVMLFCIHFILLSFIRSFCVPSHSTKMQIFEYWIQQKKDEK